MIHDKPADFLSLHKNVQYYNTHKTECNLDRELRVISKEAFTLGNLALATDTEIPALIFQKIQEYYSGNARDNKWLNLLKKDIKQIASDQEAIPIDNSLLGKVEQEGKQILSFLKHGTLDYQVSDTLNQISSLQEKPLQKLHSVDWLNQGILNVATLFDQDLADENGAIRFNLYNVISAPDNIAIIPKTIFTAEVEDRLQRWLRDMEIFEQKESGFVVLIPKVLLRKDSMENSLASLGLNPTQLSPTTIQNVFHNFKNEKATIDQWEAIWSPSSPLKKRWFFSGHGMSEYEDKAIKIAGLNESHFSKLSQVIQNQNTEIAIFETCHGGRTLPEVQNKYFAQGGFSVLSWSRIDSPTFADHFDFHSLWHGIHDYIKNSSHEQKALDSLQPLMNQYMQSLPEFKSTHIADYEKQPRILPAHSSASPTGFKAIQSKYTKDVFPIGQLELREAQLKAQKAYSQEMIRAVIDIPEDKTKVELSTPYLDIQLNIKSSKTLLKSMIPGNAQYYIDHLIFKAGNANNYFSLLLSERTKTRSHSGFFIHQLETPKEKLTDITIYVTPEGGEVVYYDEKTKTYQLLQFSKDRGSQSKQITVEEFREKAMKALISTFPSEEAVFYSTGGQEDRMAVFDQIFKQIFSTKNSEEIAPLKTFARKVLLNENPSSWIEEITALPIPFQSIATLMVLVKAKEPSFYEECSLRGLINAQNRRYIDLLPEDKKDKIYPLLIQKGIFTNKDKEDLLQARAIPILENSYDSSSLQYKGLLALVMNTDFNQALEAIEMCKRFCVWGVLKPRDFPSMKKAMLGALAPSENPAQTFTEFIPLAIRQGLSEGLDWVLAYHQEHPLLIDKKVLMELINEGVKNSFDKLSSVDKEDALAFSEFLANLKSQVEPIIDTEQTDFFLKALREDSSLLVAETLLTDSLAKKHPELRSTIIQNLVEKGSRYPDPTDFLFQLNAIFNLSTDEKNELIKEFFPRIADKGKIANLQRLQTWIPDNSEEQKQDLLRNALKEVLTTKKWDSQKVLALVDLGLNREDPKMIDTLASVISYSYLSSESLQFMLLHFRDKLDKMEENTFKKALENWKWEYGPLIEGFEYIVTERGFSIPSKVLNEVVDSLDQHQYNSDAGRGEYAQKFDYNETVAEWLAAHGVKLEAPKYDSEIFNRMKLVPRLIADDCNLPLIQSILNGIKLSAVNPKHKQFYDAILLVAARKGRLDILEWLGQQGCQYPPEIIHRAIFNAPSPKKSQMEGILLKMFA